MIEENKSSSKHYKKLSDVLGKKNVKQEVESPFDFINLANDGINVGIIKNFSEYFDLSKSDTADLLDVSEPTLYRWAKQNKNLERNHSIRIFEITDLFLYGIEVEAEGTRGGLCLAWRTDMDIMLRSYSKRHIDVLVEDNKRS